MTVVVDTNVLVQLLGRGSPLPALRRALEQGRVEWAVSTPVMMEYEEVIVRLAGAAAWEMAARMMELIRILRGTIREVSPSFRFRTITGDPDDDAFADCAIVAEADWIITSDRHFDMLRGAGYKPQPIRQEEFIQRFLRT
jgi:putative PIN family toxin of toxin-antitoxin system